MNESLDINVILLNLLKLSRAYDNAPSVIHGLKLGEETGEVQTAVSYESGYVQHKNLEEDVMHEVADVFNVCMALLASHYKDCSEEELLMEFAEALVEKAQKYSDIVGAGKFPYNLEVDDD